MGLKFKGKGNRTTPLKDDLIDIYTRQFGAPPEGILKPELERRIKMFGKCECDNKSCREPLSGYCEWDHKFRHSDSREGDVIAWRALTKACHSHKTRTKDTPGAAKTKRHAKKYNPEYASERHEKPKGRFQSRPMQSRPMQSRGFDKTKTRGFDGKVRGRA